MQTRMKYCSSLFCLVLLAISFSLAACDSDKSQAEKIIALCKERRLLMNELYTAYKGPTTANTANSGSDLATLYHNSIEATERLSFEAKTQLVGRDFPVQNILIEDSILKFFSDPKRAETAREIFEIELRLKILTKELNNESKRLSFDLGFEFPS